MTRIIIDPGHGGDRDVGRSSAFGVAAGGLLEKDVTLDVARHVAAGIGGASLTRGGDRNLSLRDRAGQGSGADVFVSIHANAGPPGARGSETWVHPGAGAGSRTLAGSIQRALDRFGGGAPAPQAGPMAVLSPAVLGGATDACLVELDYLSSPDGAARLGDPGTRRAIGAAIADAIRGHLDRRRFGDGEEDPGIDEPIPDDATAEVSSYPMGLDTPTPEYPGAARFAPARAGHFRVPSSPRTIDQIVIHITDGTSTNGTVRYFQSASNTRLTSAHYVIGQDGEVVQMVQHANIAHHATTANRRSIGIEHVALSPSEVARLRRRGRNLQPLFPTEEQYRASAALVAWLCCRFDIPRDRQHILGHSEATQTTHSDCPNGVWDWDRYMRYVNQAYSCQPVGDFPPPPTDRAIGRRRYGDASEFDDVADLTYDRSKDTRAVSTPDAAKAVLRRLRAWSGTSPWTHLDKDQICTRLERLLDKPMEFQQGATPLCGPASFYSIWCLRDPVAFAEHAVALFQTGRASIGASYAVTPGRSLVTRDYGAVNAVAGGLPPQADWMLFGSIRNTEDDVFVWDGSETGNTVSGITFPREIKRWLDATGLYASVDNRIGDELAALRSKGFPAAEALDPVVGRDIICLVQSNAFVGIGAARTPWYAEGFPSHYVILTGRVFHSTARSSPEGSPMRITVTSPVPYNAVSFPCWSYGLERPGCYVATMDSFVGNYYGAIVATMR